MLVTVERHYDRRSLRLDFGKGMFLHPAPAEIDPRAAREVTQHIVQQMAPVRRGPS